MIVHRLPALLLQLVVLVQAGFVAAVAPPYVAPARAAGPGCEVTSSASGGMLSACPDASSFADFSGSLSLGMDALRGQSATSDLSVTSTPDGATVLLNGLQAGLTPLQTKVAAGSYLVRIEKDGFAPYSKTVNVAADRAGSVDATLTAVETSLGSFNWLRATDLIGQAGGYPDGQLSVTSFVRDRDGAYWAAFVNYADRKFILEEPIDAPGFLPFITEPRFRLKVSGVARSADAGASWSVVRSWKDSFSARAWTSDKFIDSQWDPEEHGFPASHEHWMRAYYNERTVEQYWVEDLIPRKDGGVSIVLYTYKAHLPQELQYAWDNIANPNFPGEYMGDTVVRLTDDPVFEEVSSEEAQDRWGVSREDLATYWWQASEDGRELVDTAGGEGAMTISGVPDPYTVPKYHGSHDGVDYFLSYQSDGSDVGGVGYILASRDGGRTLTLDTTYPLGYRANNRQPLEDLRIGPDGTKYLVVHYQWAGDNLESLIYEVGAGGQLRELGKTPPGLVVGVAGGNNLPFLSADFDSSGGLHAAFRGSHTAEDNSLINVYYQYFPKAPATYDSVALLTQPDCAACQAAIDFLGQAGVGFTENPSNLPAEVAATAASEASSAGYPVLVRLGAENVVKGGADVAAISRLLSISHPVLIEQHAPRRVAGSPYAALQPQWMLMVVEDDQPKVVVDRTDGVVALSLVGGQWTPAPLLATPDSVTDAPGIGFAKHYPAFPGGIGSGFYSSQYDKPFNHIDRLSDFVYLYHSASTAVQDPYGETNTQFDYTLWTTEAPAESGAYRAVATASQLVPAGVFYIALGDGGEAGSVTGELAQYVTAQGEVTQDGQRFYRVVADLRQQGETATDGNIVGRTIAGSLSVDTVTEEGAPETRQISLILLVQNTRLRAFDPDTADSARDITNEAVHFTGANERWVVTNNIALPNSIPCGSDQAIVLDPNGYSIFTAATVAEFELESCMAALEVQPTVLSDCTSWDDAKLVLAADTIHSLAQSLPLLRTAGETNYKAAFGTREATVFRVVSLDEPWTDAPVCATDVTGRTGAVVLIEGQILGGSETFSPSVTIVSQDSVVVRTASTALPPIIAWQREWLELESAFLEAALSVSMDDEALWDWISFSASDRRDQYLTELLATRALLHCNYEGRDIAAVRALMNRTAVGSEALLGVAHCLQGFVVEPYKHWSHANTPAWPARTVSFMGSVVNDSLSSNPTLAFLDSAAAADPALYGRLIIARGRDLESRAGSSIRGLALDYALDHYARLLTVISGNMGGGVRAGVLRAVLMASPLERQTVREVISCARSFGTANPFAQMLELTEARSYTAGIPCVDRQGAGQAKIDTYRRLAVGLRGGLFTGMLQAAGTDLDLLFSYLDMATGVMDEVDRVEQQYGPGTRIDAWQPDLPALVQFMIVRRHIEALVEAKGEHYTVGDAKALVKGLIECGVGFVKALISREGLALMGLGFLAWVAGPFALAAGGVLFVGSGVAFTGLLAYNLQQAWEGLDLAGKVAGVCGVLLSAVMTVAPVKGLVKYYRRTPAQLREAPPKVIDEATLPNSGKANGVPLEEQAANLTGQGGSVKPTVEVQAPPRSAALEALLDSVPEGKRSTLAALADRMAYDAKAGTPAEMAQVAFRQAIFDRLARAYGTSVEAAFAERLKLVDGAPSDSVRADIVEISAAFVEGLLPPPKSMRLNGDARGLAGSDAQIVEAAAGDGFQGDKQLGGSQSPRAIQASVFQAVLRSDRVPEALRAETADKGMYTAEEVAYLKQVQQTARPGFEPDLVDHLNSRLIVESLQTAFREELKARSIDLGTTIESTSARYVAAGASKETHLLEVKLKDVADAIPLAVKKGQFDSSQIADQTFLAEQGLAPMPRMNDTIMVDSVLQQRMFIEEWVPGETVTKAAGKPGLSRAVADFDVRRFERTQGKNGEPQGTTKYGNSDMRNDNMNVYENADGQLEVKSVDYGSEYRLRETEADAYTGNFASRYGSTGRKVDNFAEYLQATVDAKVRETGVAPEAVYDLMRQSAKDLRDPNYFSGLLIFLSQFPEDFAAIRAGAASAIDAFLASKGAFVAPPLAVMQPHASGWIFTGVTAQARSPLPLAA